MADYKTKKEWVDAVNAYKYEHGTTKGFYTGPGKNQYTDSDGVTWDYKAGSKGGPGGARRASSTGAYTDRRDSMEVDQTLGAEKKNQATAQFKEAGKEAGVQKGVHQMHHMRTLNQYEPLLAGLNEEDTIQALKWFESEGFPLGNSKGNLLKQFMNQDKGGTTIADTHQGTGSIHEWMRTHRLEPTTKQAEYKKIAKMFEGKSLNERLPMYVTYLENIQGAAQEQLQQPTSYTKQAQLQKSVGKIESGPRAGQPLPVNRRTLGDAIIRDLRMEGGKALYSAGVGGVLGFLTNQEATTKLGQGDVAGAIETGGKDFLVGETISQVAQRYVLPHVTKIVPKIAQGVARFSPPVAIAATAIAGLDGVTRIGNDGKGLLETGKEAEVKRKQTIKEDGMTSARRQFRRSTK